MKILKYEEFNERYTRTVGFRYSKPTIHFQITAESNEKIPVKFLLKFLNDQRIDHKDLLVDDNYFDVKLSLYNEKELPTIIDQLTDMFNLKSNLTRIKQLYE